jgi:hypothetical protein
MPAVAREDGEVWNGKRVALAAVALTILAGCSSVGTPPTYTQDELKAICERHGGWWHPDDLMGGFCEYQRDGMP